jgi:hypothetical protein
MLKELLLVALVSAPALAHAQWFANAGAGTVYDSNWSRAALATDIKSDTALEMFASGGRRFDLGDTLSASLGGELKMQSFGRYGGLTNTQVGVQGALRYKFGIGLDQPWLRLSAGWAKLNYVDDYRDGWRTDFGLTVGKRLAEGLELRGTLTRDVRRSDKELRLPPWFSGKAYDVQGNTVSLAADYTLGSTWLLSAGLAQRRGLITSTGVHTQAIWDASTAWSKDFALGDDSYSIYARTTMINVGVSYALSDATSLNLNIARWMSRANGGFDYNNNIFRVSILHRML